MGYFDILLSEMGIVDTLDKMNEEFDILSESDYNRKIDKLELEILDINKFISVNDCKEITNPVFYTRDNIPTNDGLLSYTIFGTTQAERSGIFGYIDLNQYFLDPSCYKTWCKIDSNVKRCVHKEAKFVVTEKGELVEDEAGKNGVKFLKANINKIVFSRNESTKRDLRISYLEKNRDKMFIDKYPVIPPYYRDTNTGKRSVGVGGINRIYSQLIVAINSLKTSQEYGFDMSGAMEGRVQELLQAIYDWFAGNGNSLIQSDDMGIGIGSKFGVLRRANMSKTANYAARLVISPSEAKVNSPDDMFVNYQKSAAPLAALMACFRPFVQFYTRRFFENIFMGQEQIEFRDKNGNSSYEVVKDPLITFSDDRIKDEMDKFLGGYNNRFKPVAVNLENGKTVYMVFKGNFEVDNKINDNIYRRKLTWCDVFYMATVKAVHEKHLIITRYPMDSRYNQIFTKIDVSSTKETEPIYYNGTFYPYYPKIRNDEIGGNTGNKFVDTMKVSNMYLPAMDGDFDGDTVSIKGVFTDEANEELEKFMNDKLNFIDLGCKGVRSFSPKVAQSLYNLTLILPDDKSKITRPVF